MPVSRHVQLLVYLCRFGIITNMKNAWEKFKLNTFKHGIIKHGDKVVLAVSGGPDSVCMMHLFWRLRKIFDIELLVVYLDHGLRKKSKEEIKFINSLAKKLEIKACIRRISVKDYSHENKISLETAGRDLRYGALVSLAGELKFNKVATGHNANDNAETVLMFMIRGTGQEGLCGIPALRESAQRNIEIIRPILPLTRNEIITYLKSQKLSYCVDHTNFHLKFARNRIRHKLIPELEKYNPGFIDHVFNMSRIVSLENEYLTDLTAKAVKKIVIVKSNKIVLDLNGFFRYNKVLQLRILKDIIPQRKSLDNITRILEWIYTGDRKIFVLSNTWNLEKSKNKLNFLKTNANR
jgi:tRNA(Ile)-lysidine synthase